MRVRDAVPEDIDQVRVLTVAKRRQLAEWSPSYFRQREGADDLHGMFLEFIVASADHRTYVATDGGSVAGFFTHISQPDHEWVDDLSVAHDSLWPAFANSIVGLVGERPLVACISPHDTAAQAALRAEGFSTASRYFARSTVGEPSLQWEESGEAAVGTPRPNHTFGVFDSAVHGALSLSLPENGSVVGSPSVNVPIYDPGGPTTVVDRIGGTDRHALARAALAACHARGDAQLVVVVEADDADLLAAVSDLGFVAEIELLELGAK